MNLILCFNFLTLKFYISYFAQFYHVQSKTKFSSFPFFQNFTKFLLFFFHILHTLSNVFLLILHFLLKHLYIFFSIIPPISPKLILFASKSKSHNSTFHTLYCVLSLYETIIPRISLLFQELAISKNLPCLSKHPDFSFLLNSHLI